MCVHACACVCVQSKLLNVKLLCDITAARQQKQQQPSDPVVGTSIHAYIHTCLKCAFVCVYLCVSEVYRSCLCVIISWCACVCVCRYLFTIKWAALSCFAHELNLCMCLCLCLCLSGNCTQIWVHCNWYNNIHSHTHTGTYSASCAGSFAAFKFMLHCKMPSPADWQCKEGDKRERQRGRTTSFAGQKAAVYRCMCACVCVQHFTKSAVRLALSLGALFI